MDLIQIILTLVNLQIQSSLFIKLKKYFQVYLNRAIISQPVESKKTCMYKDKKSGVTYEINEGEVSEIKKSKVRVCTDGKNLLISKEEFPPPWKYACDGELVF